MSDYKTIEDLYVFEKAYKVSLEIHKLSLQLPKIEQYALGDQMRRASKSICANLAEGYGKKQDLKKNFEIMFSLAWDQVTKCNYGFGIVKI